MTSALRREYLAAMGLESWVVRKPGGGGSAEAGATAAVPGAAAARAEVAGVEAKAGATAARARPVASAVPMRPAMAPPAPRPATGLEVAAEPIAAPGALHREAGFDWTQLRERVAACTRCGLSATRTQTVFGVGNLQAQWLIVGEAPGADEDRAGEPFVGRAGQLLNAMLRAIGLPREEVYIANTLKCRPPHNRDPQPNETGECFPFLERQIELLKPKIMLVVGRIAAHNLLRTDVSLSRLRQQVHHFGASRVPLVVTYHPAYLLRAPSDKRKAWEDLKFAREVLARG
jgi:uracil-DNA glycosylase family 4